MFGVRGLCNQRALPRFWVERPRSFQSHAAPEGSFLGCRFGSLIRKAEDAHWPFKATQVMRSEIEKP